MRYIILAKGGHDGFDTPRQLSVINGERLLDRTIRLLRENGIDDISVTGDYTDIDAKVFNPPNNTYNYHTGEGYWLDAFNDVLDEPVCLIWGDVYFSDEAIKTIVETETNDTMFFCSYKNTDKRYIKKWDEPFAYKIVNVKSFKRHVEMVKKLWDVSYCKRNPIVWEVYRSINGININEHKLADNVTIINDITCDIDNPKDIFKIEMRVGKKMVRVETLDLIETRNGLQVSRFNEIQELVRHNAENNAEGYIYPGDIFLATPDLADYFLGKNRLGKDFVKVIEVIPEKKKGTKKVEEKTEEKPKKKATRKSK